MITKYARGKNPNSIKALHDNRQKGLETVRKKKEMRLIRQEIKKEEKEKQKLDLEFEIFKIKQKKKEDIEYKRQYEKRFYPLSEEKLYIVIKNVFDN